MAARKSGDRCRECGAELRLGPATCPLCGADLHSDEPHESHGIDDYQTRVRNLREELRKLRENRQAS